MKSKKKPSARKCPEKEMSYFGRNEEDIEKGDYPLLPMKNRDRPFGFSQRT